MAQTDPKRFSVVRVSLRLLLILMSAICILVAIWASHVKPLADQHEAMKMVNRLGGNWDARPIEGSFWQEWLLEPQAFQEVLRVNLDGVKLETEDAKRLSDMKHLTILSLQKSSFSDANMAAMPSLRELQELSLRYCQITDDGIARLGDKQQLKVLRLTGCDITDASVAGLSDCSSLRQLFIRWTQITPQGVERLREQLPDCEIYYSPRG